MRRLLLRSAALAGAVALTFAGAVAPAAAVTPTSDRGAAECFDPYDVGAGARGGGNDNRGPDHRDVSASEQRAIAKRTNQILAARGISKAEAKQQAAATTIPVYVHVMRDDSGNGDVTDGQVAQQIAVLNNTFGGGESRDASDTGFRFALVDTFRYNNDTWHQDKASQKYRSQTRQGGAGALNIWLVEFDLLGVATFPWDYAKKGAVDGIRVHFDSLPGGSIENFNLGETATHEAGHWLGLFHTFQGGCTPVNDSVDDTPAQSSPTSGCPEGRDSCALPGLDPIHNYMDYSWDSCYTEFSAGQTSRMADMFAAYRS